MKKGDKGYSNIGILFLNFSLELYVVGTYYSSINEMILITGSIHNIHFKEKYKTKLVILVPPLYQELYLTFSELGTSK